MSFFFDTTPFPVRFHGMHPSFRGVSQLHDDIDRIFGGFMGRPENEPVSPEKMADFLPDIDLTSDEKTYQMKVELPGVPPENVDIKLDGGVLTISGEKKEETVDDKTKTHVKERRFGSFMRSMTLPEDADADNISASSKDGVLTVSIPRKAPEKPQARTISVQKGE